MKKEFGVFLILGLLVLSMSFGSAGWFSDTWGKITGKGITGNVINQYGFDDSELYCGNSSTCSRWNTIRCGSKAGHLSAAGVNVSKVASVDLLSIKCFTGNGPAKIVSCPTGTSYDVCVENNNDGNGNYILLGAKYGVAGAECTEDLMLECPSSSFTLKNCVNGKYVDVVPTPTCPVEPEITCNDSDGGLNYYEKGYTRTNGVLVGADSCYEDGRVDEWYCSNSSTVASIPYPCLGGCVDGACVNYTAPVSSCNETTKECILREGQSVSPLNNNIKISSISSDSVVLNVGGALTSKLIEGEAFMIGSLKIIILDILYTQKESALSTVIFNYSYTTQNITCTDSDGGLNYYVKGVAVDNESSQSDSCSLSWWDEDHSWWDYKDVASCSSGTNGYPFLVGSDSSDKRDRCLIREMQCSLDGTSKFSTFSYCPNGCVDGACVNSSCDSAVSLIKTPVNLTMEDTTWQVEYDSDYDDEMQYYAGWRYFSDNQHSYVWSSVSLLSDSSAVQDRLNNALENGICEQTRVYTNYDAQEYQVVYVCKNIWRIANQNQQVSQGSAWNYQNDVVAIWFNQGRLFNMEFSSYDYYNCYDGESCQRIETENHRRQQNDLIESIDKLINNNIEYASPGYLDWRAEQFVKYFLNACPSEVEETEHQGSWYCKMEPAICPPHGEQKQICTRLNPVLDKEEKRETTMQCSPGICSGCYIPRWFGDSGLDNKCIQYGFRFGQESVVGLNEVPEGENYGGDVIVNISSNDLAYLKFGEGDMEGNWPWIAFEGMVSEGGIYSYRYPTDGMSVNKDSQFRVKDIDAVNRKITLEFIGSLDSYCDIDGQIKQQKVSQNGEWAKCQNNYECFSNVCSNGECVDTAALARQLTGFKGFVVRMLCRISNPFNEASYSQCLIDNQ